jgi:alkylation response protein AidB-like acyl-CoA dehydrogenase
MIELSGEQKDIRQAAREFAEGEFTDIAFECDEKETYPGEVLRKACKSGFIGVFIDERYEGAGLGMLEYALILEEFWRVDPGCGNISLSTLGSEFIQDYGNESQKEKYLTPLAKGTAIMGIPTTEDHAESFRYARNNGDGYVLNGSNNFVFNGNQADHLIIVAQEIAADGGNTGRFSTFVIDKRIEGVKTRRFSDKLGIRASDVAELALEDVCLPSINLVGMEGKGMDQLDAFLDRLCIYNSAQAVGASQACLERAIKYSRQRVQFGHPIGWFQLIQLKIAEMATRIEAARNFCYGAARGFDLGKRDRKALSMASWFARETAGIVTAETLQIHGGYGYMKDMDIERFYRDVQFLEFFGTSREKEKMRVALDALGRTE